MKTWSIGLCGFTALTACYLLAAPAPGQDQPNSKDVNFMKEAAQGGMLEVKLGEIARQNATNPMVKQFAQRMVDDHSKANQELKTLADKKRVELPKDVEGKHKKMIDDLTRVKGAEFDKAYMRHMVEDHEQDVAEFREASKNVQDKDLKAWVDKTTPVINDHLKQAKEIHATIEKGGK